MAKPPKPKSPSSRATPAAASSRTPTDGAPLAALSSGKSRQSARDTRQAAFSLDAGHALGKLMQRKRAGRALAARLLGRKPLSAAIPSGNFMQPGKAPAEALKRRREAATLRIGERRSRGITLRLTAPFLDALKAAEVKPEAGAALTEKQYQAVRAAISASAGTVARRSRLVDDCRAKKTATGALGTTQPSPLPASSAETGDAAMPAQSLEQMLSALVA